MATKERRNLLVLGSPLSSFIRNKHPFEREKNWSSNTWINARIKLILRKTKLMVHPVPVFSMCDMKISQHQVIHLRVKRLKQGIHQHLENLQA